MRHMLMPLTFFCVCFTFALLAPNAYASSRPTSASSITLPLSGGLLHTSGFYINATLGGQFFTLQIDTSYSSLIIPHQKCQGCRTGDRRYHPDKSKTSSVIPCEHSLCKPPTNQCHQKSCSTCSRNGNCCTHATKNCAFNVLYGDKSSGNGTLYKDTLKIHSPQASLQASLLFGAMHSESHDFELPYADGVLGLAFQKGACHPACIPPAMDAIVNQTAIGNVFTICVSHYGGTLVLGAAQNSLATSQFKYINLLPSAENDRFIVPAKPQWKIAGIPLDLPAVTSAVLSTGTTHTVVPKSVFLILLNHMMKHYCHIPGLCSFKSWFRPHKCSSIPEESVKAMPDIQIFLDDNVYVTLKPEDYLIKYLIVKGIQLRCVSIIATDSLLNRGYSILLGTAVMRRNAIVFDRENLRIGVAPANPQKCGPLTGSEHGIPGGGISKGSGPILTPDSPVASAAESSADDVTEEQLKKAQLCHAQPTCDTCSKNPICSYGYQTGRCISAPQPKLLPYPFCSGIFCACFAVGVSGWHFGIAVGVLLAMAVFLSLFLIYRKHQEQNRYQTVQRYEEQDLETF